MGFPQRNSSEEDAFQSMEADLKAFSEREHEATMTYDELLAELKLHNRNKPKYQTTNIIIKLLLAIFFVFVLLYSTNSTATEPAEPSDQTAFSKLNTFEKIAVFELMAGFNAYLASENPKAFGLLAALLFPLGVEGATSATTTWVSLIGAESIAIYNLSINENKTTKSDIFRNNMIAWHLFALATGLSGYIVGNADSKESATLLPTPTGGIQLAYKYRF